MNEFPFTFKSSSDKTEIVCRDINKIVTVFAQHAEQKNKYIEYRCRKFRTVTKDAHSILIEFTLFVRNTDRFFNSLIDAEY